MRTLDDLEPADKRALVLVDLNTRHPAAALARYRRPLSPFIGVVMRSQLHVVADQAAPARRRSP
jgi:hypothetical protein